MSLVAAASSTQQTFNKHHCMPDGGHRNTRYNPCSLRAQSLMKVPDQHTDNSRTWRGVTSASPKPQALMTSLLRTVSVCTMYVHDIRVCPGTHLQLASQRMSISFLSRVFSWLLATCFDFLERSNYNLCFFSNYSMGGALLTFVISFNPHNISARCYFSNFTRLGKRVRIG